MIIHGDCLDKLKGLPSSSVDAIVTDPPYGLSFMGKKWDYDVPSEEIWKEALRVLKPGGHALIACGTRTQHRMVVKIEDGGFEIRDVITWHYGSGFPKSHNLSKGIDKQAGAKREVIGHNPNGRPNMVRVDASVLQPRVDAPITAPATEEAKQWDGWGTALKPATEFWTLCRKPLEGTVAANVLKWGTGAINVDAGRIAGAIPQVPQPKIPNGDMLARGKNYHGRNGELSRAEGRWPANVIFDEEAAAMLDEQTQGLHGAGSARKGSKDPRVANHDPTSFSHERSTGEMHRFGDSGGASRFFYCAKASKSERNAGLEGMPEKRTKSYEGGPIVSANSKTDGGSAMKQNHHPTVKPIKLMEYLIKLITPPGGVVLDPFMGSGSTGVAAKRLGFIFIGIEREKEYVEIAERRIG